MVEKKIIYIYFLQLGGISLKKNILPSAYWLGLVTDYTMLLIIQYNSQLYDSGHAVGIIFIWQ